MLQIEGTHCKSLSETKEATPGIKTGAGEAEVDYEEPLNESILMEFSLTVVSGI